MTRQQYTLNRNVTWESDVLGRALEVVKRAWCQTDFNSYADSKLKRVMAYLNERVECQSMIALANLDTY